MSALRAGCGPEWEYGAVGDCEEVDEDVWVRHWVSLLNYGRWELSVIPGWTGNLLSNMQFFAGSRYNYGKILLYLRLAF